MACYIKDENKIREFLEELQRKMDYLQGWAEAADESNIGKLADKVISDMEDLLYGDDEYDPEEDDLLDQCDELEDKAEARKKKAKQLEKKLKAMRKNKSK